MPETNKETVTTIAVFFDGTGVNLNSKTEKIFGRSVIGRAFLEEKGEVLHYHRSKKKVKYAGKKLRELIPKFILPGLPLKKRFILKRAWT